MRQQLRNIYRSWVMFGFDFQKTWLSLRGLPLYWRDLRTLKRQKGAAGEEFPFGRAYPCLDDRFVESGSGKSHYFHQDLLVARRVFSNVPALHIDVGSRIDGFVAHVAAFRPITVMDIRPLSNSIPNVTFIQVNFMDPLPAKWAESCDSASCLHALEHFGLGRYGEPVRFDGYRVGFDNLYKLLKPGGKLYFSVPIGPQRIEFNAHRVFSLAFLQDFFRGRFTIDAFSLVDDQGDFHENMQLTPDRVASNCGCQFGCGIFELTRKDLSLMF